MRRVLTETWIPAAIFAVATGVGLLLASPDPIGGDGSVFAAVAAGIAGVVASPIWWLAVARRGSPTLARGALAGASIGMAAVAALVLIAVGALVWHQIRGQPWGGEAAPMLAFMFAVMILVGLPVAAVIGSVVGVVVAVGLRWIGHPGQRTGLVSQENPDDSPVEPGAAPGTGRP